MTNEDLSEIVTKIDVTLVHLAKTVDELSGEVKELQDKKNYWMGAIAAIGVAAMTFGAIISFLMTTLLHK